MRINVNGTPREITSADLHSALAELGWADARVATALNGSFVPTAARATTKLANGDEVEVLTAMQGG